jgi:aminoglycoside phosphotransferase (APT) family kinase protein
VGLETDGVYLLHERANAVYHLPEAGAVVRLRRTRGSSEWQQRLASAVQVTAWLASRGFPTVVPMPLRQPVSIDEWTVTFWHYVPFDDTAPPADPAVLGRLLRELHSSPAPPVELADTNPLGSLLDDLEQEGPALAAEQRDWLRERAAQIAAAYPTTDMPLGRGMIHGDWHAGNLFPHEGTYLVGDWDSVSWGPRAQDLVPALDGVLHFGEPRSNWIDMCGAYAVDPDIQDHPGVRLLTQARELRSLAAYIRSAARPPVRAELRKRLRTLMDGATETWQPV